MNRRRFLHTVCYSSVAALATSRVTHLAFAADSAARPDGLLVVLFLRGGCDALHLVGPANDRAYIAARPPQLRVTDDGDNKGLELANGFKGVDMRLHREAAPLGELYDGGDLAIVHASGITNGTRSHFEAMDMMERGVADQKSLTVGTGWLTRTLDALAPRGLLPAVCAGDALPASLFGSTQAVSLADVRNFSYGQETQSSVLKELYAGNTALQRAGSKTLAAITAIQAKLPRNADGGILDYQPEGGAKYEGGLADSFATIAQLAKMDTGLRVATVDYDGWDTHEGQPGRFAELTGELSRATAAFYNDMSRFHSKLTVVVVSEFGRRLKSNQSDGTDHGHGGVTFVLGGGVKGGRLYGRWTGLASEALDQGADLAVTTDYRAVLHEVLTRRIGLRDTSAIFPGFKPAAPVGLV